MTALAAALGTGSWLQIGALPLSGGQLRSRRALRVSRSEGRATRSLGLRSAKRVARSSPLSLGTRAGITNTARACRGLRGRRAPVAAAGAYIGNANRREVDPAHRDILFLVLRSTGLIRVLSS